MNPSIRMIGRYGSYRVGEILSPPASLRKILLDRKLAEMVEPPHEIYKTPRKKQKRK